MFKQRQRHHQRHDALVILADQVLHLLFVFATDGPLQIAAEVLQHVGVGPARRTFFQRRHQLAEIARAEFLRVGMAQGA
ncbi:hypothetical protein D3C76_1813310 [compost metagenome]